MLLTLVLASALSSCAGPSPAPEPEPLPFVSRVPAESLLWHEFGPFEPAQAAAFARERREALEKLLAPNLDPYSGKIVTAARCRRENLPAPGRRGDAGWLSLYSSQNRILGLCEPPVNLQKTQYLVLYCAKERKSYVIRHFYTEAEAWREEPVASCRP